jgi:light-regulated signal transduction histidine kinase (bacteriophytochrome)
MPLFIDLDDGMLRADGRLRELLALKEGDELVRADVFLEKLRPEERKELERRMGGDGVFTMEVVFAGHTWTLACARFLGKLRGLLTEDDLMVSEVDVPNQEADAMTYIISHDLRAPLRAVAGYGRWLQMDCADGLGADGARLLDRLLAETEKMNEMLVSLTRLSRTSGQQVERHRMDLGEEGASAWRDLGGAKEGLRLPAGAQVNADGALMRSLLIELLTNAQKSRVEGRPLHVALQVTEVEGGWLCALVDDGKGFNMHSAGKLFHPFQKMHSASEFPGVGMGLAIAAKICRKHGGRIWISSAEDAGTAVIFTIGKA